MTVYTAAVPALLPTHKQSPISCISISRCTRKYILQLLFLTPRSSKCAGFTNTIPSFSQQFGTPPPVHTAATLFQKMCYDNKDALSAGIIVAGWDKEQGPSVYNIPLGGGLFRQPWAIGGKFGVSLLIYHFLMHNPSQALVPPMSMVTAMLPTRTAGTNNKPFSS